MLASTRVDAVPNRTDLRSIRLSALIPDELHLLVVPLYPLPGGTAVGGNSTVFASVTEYPPLLDGPRSPRRHLRLTDNHYLRLSRPAQFVALRRMVSQFIAEHGVGQIVVFGTELAELVADRHDCRKILDVCDSATLAKRRARDHAGAPARGTLADALDLYRARRTEARLPALFDHVTTVSDVDTAEIVRLSGNSADVHTVPNGVDEAYLVPMPPPARRRGVVFWGNLDFEPNIAALAYFFTDVWFPRLRAASVEVEVIGGNAPTWLVRLAAYEPLVHLAGYVTDLRGAVCRYPVMINPMRTGSGLKNKVLEAFGMGITVVSTALGVEALPAVRNGEHLVIADVDAFGDAVLDLLDDPVRRLRLRTNANSLLHEHYRWSIAARPWRQLFEPGAMSRAPAAGSPPLRTSQPEGQR